MKKKPSSNDLIRLFTSAANPYMDGHLTILKFTTGWKCMLGTPDLDTGEGREQIRTLKTHKSLKGAIVAELRKLKRVAE